MPLSKSDQDLKYDLQGTASDLKWSVVELHSIAERLSQAGNQADAQAVQRICTLLLSAGIRLTEYKKEVDAGVIIRCRR